MLRRKPFIDEHRKQAQEQLKARLELLKTRGMDDRTISRDAKVKQYQGMVRKAKRQLDSIAAMQTLIGTKKSVKAQKAAAAKAAPQAPKMRVKSAAPNRPKKERKPVPAEE